MKRESLTAMSFNVYVGTPTAQRETSVLQTILNYTPDTLGVQEASTAWMAYLSKHLDHLYDYVGDGRDGSKNGEHSAIFYRKDRFDLIETKTKWLSDTPDMVSKFPESCLNRIFTYAILLEKKSNVKIMVINTHLDHISPDARDRQIAVILAFIKKYSDYPIVFTGDLNDTPKAGIYQALSEQLADSAVIAQTAESRHTFHNYGAADVTLDYIFVTPEWIEVSDYKVITKEANGMLPSDHYPVLIQYQLKNKAHF